MGVGSSRPSRRSSSDASIVSRSFPEGDQFLFISARGDGLDVTFVDPDADESDRDEQPAAEELRLDSLALGARGGAEESAFLMDELQRLRSIVDGEGWLGYKERDLASMRGDGFWEAPERFAVLARIEYVDRVQAALRPRRTSRAPCPGSGKTAADQPGS